MANFIDPMPDEAPFSNVVLRKDAPLAAPVSRGRKIVAREVQDSTFAVDRLPPHSIESEKGVLGCVLLSASTCMPESMTLLRSNPEVFYDLRHRTIYKTMMDMFEKNIPIDSITLMQHLKDTQPVDDKGRPKDGNLLEMVGGIAYLMEIPDSVPTAANLSHYATVVFEKYLLRQLIQTCTESIGRLYEHEGDVDGLMDELEGKILKISSDRINGEGALHIKEHINGAVREIEASYNKGTIDGLSSGFGDLDSLTGGFHSGNMIVLAARTSVGKTSLAMNIAEHVAVDCGLPVGVFSLEMPGIELAKRMICCRARVNMRSVRDGYLKERDFPKLTLSSGKLAGAKIWIDDAGGMSIMELRAKARMMAYQHGIKLLIIDYLQLARGMKKRVESRQTEVSEVSFGIKLIAKELGIPVIVLSQLNRDIEKDKNRRPRLSDLRESGSIEQDADVVCMLYRVVTNSEEEEDDCEVIPIRMLVAKNRNGPTGELDLTFIKSYTRFESAAKISEDDVPFQRDPEQQELVNDKPYKD